MADWTARLIAEHASRDMPLRRVWLLLPSTGASRLCCRVRSSPESPDRFALDVPENPSGLSRCAFGSYLHDSSHRSAAPVLDRTEGFNTRILRTCSFAL